MRGVKLRYCEKILLERREPLFAFLSSLIYNHSAAYANDSLRNVCGRCAQGKQAYMLVSLVQHDSTALTKR